MDEHVRNAMRVADTIVVMDLGSVAWTGSPEHADQEALAAAYLGAGARTARASTMHPPPSSVG